MRFKNALAITVAGLYLCMAVALPGHCQEKEGDRQAIYQQLTPDGEQSVDTSWSPEIDHEGWSKDRNTQESLRSTYEGVTVPDHSCYDFLDGEPEHKCVSLVCDRGHCKFNYCVMYTASWCIPCKKMHPIIRELREEGYLIYVLNVEDFEKSADRFKIKAVPTFIIFDKGREIKRAIGKTDADWFRDNLQTLKEQTEEPEEEDDSELSDVYDLL